MSTEQDLRVLVTGATGFVAHHIIQLLQKEGYRVRGTVRNIKNESKLKSLRNLCPDAKHPLELVAADLTEDVGWSDAIRGCTYCIHSASPFPNAPPNKEDDLIIPAVEGTKRVLRACADTGTVKRVVLTSSIAAVHGEAESDCDRLYTEDDWTDTTSRYADAYAKSKTLAERAAWDFMRSLPPGNKMELAVVNPSIILGPSINGEICTSLEFVKRLMDWSVPMLTSMYISFCDVRDVALAHLRAMILPEAANSRHLIASDHLWWLDIARILQKEFSSQGYFIPTYQAPYFVVYLSSFFDKSFKLVVDRYGQKCTFTNARMKNVLKVEPREAKKIVLDTAYNLIDIGLLYKAKGYEPREQRFS